MTSNKTMIIDRFDDDRIIFKKRGSGKSVSKVRIMSYVEDIGARIGALISIVSCWCICICIYNVCILSLLFCYQHVSWFTYFFLLKHVFLNIFTIHLVQCWLNKFNSILIKWILINVLQKTERSVAAIYNSVGVSVL